MDAAAGAKDCVVAQAARRRTFAIISHPDAGKSTLTEALALHARVLSEAGAVHGKHGRRGVTSDWLELERQRGISVTSAVLQFEYDNVVINLLDTPGHADFSEDTYRVLAAVDAAVMLVDAAKGVEAQTLRLFDVCRHRRIPVVTFVNKWDRPGIEPLQLLDDIEKAIGLAPAPLVWPVGPAGALRAMVDRSSGRMSTFPRTGGARTKTVETEVDPAEVEAEDPHACSTARDELDLLTAVGADFDHAEFVAARQTPVLFGAAVADIGVRQLLDTLVRFAPAPRPFVDASGGSRALDESFSGFVFKIQANMDPSHRDRVAFVRVCSGRFERGMVVTHARSGRPFATKYAHQVFGRDRQTVEEAFPGDVVVLVNAGQVRVGDSLYVDSPVRFPDIPTFAPEHFSVARPLDGGRWKQFRRGIEALGEEGAIQLLESAARGAHAPILAAVGPMQFDVVKWRMEREYGAAITFDRLPYSVARGTTEGCVPILERESGVEIARRRDGTPLVLVLDRFRLRAVMQRLPDVVLDSLVAGTE